MDQVLKHSENLMEKYQHMEEHLQKNEVPYLSISYESLHKHAVFSDIFQFLGVDDANFLPGIDEVASARESWEIPLTAESKHHSQMPITYIRNIDDVLAWASAHRDRFTFCWLSDSCSDEASDAMMSVKQ